MAEDLDAPHGRDPETGKPLAPYGMTVDGKPRKSNRGARPGQRGNRPRGSAAGSTRPASTSSTRKGPTAADRKQMLCELSSMLLETPLAAASQVPQLQKKIGPRQADALAGDAFIIGQYMPQLADGLIFYSQTNPKALSWLDKIEESGPMVVVAAALFQMGKALVHNHLAPDPRLAEAGRNMVGMRMAMMAQAVNDQAAAYRAQQEPPAPTPHPGPPPAHDPYTPDEPTRMNDFAGV